MKYKPFFAAALAVALTGCGAFTTKPTAPESIAAGDVDTALDIIERELIPAEKTSTPKATKAETQTGATENTKADPQPTTDGADAPPPAAEHKSSWIDNVDLEKIFSNPWLIAAVFLLIQWFEIWYYNRTGKTSKTIDAAEAAMNAKLGIIQKVLYRLWRWRYFKKHPEKKNPDKPETEKEKK